MASRLDGILQELDRVSSSLSSNPTVAANRYLIWTENTEQQLLESYQNISIARHLHSERYWRIRSLTDTTSRPVQLIQAEIQMQKMHLAELLGQLQRYISLLAFPPDHWAVVLDTNVYIHGKLFHEVEWQRQTNSRRATIVLPLVILDELDQIKDRDPEFGRRAQSTLRALDKLTQGKQWSDHLQLRQNVWLQLLDEPQGHHRQQGQDDEIVRQSAYISQVNDSRMLLITRDRGMRLRTQSAGLKSQELPKDLERIRKANDE